MRTDACPIAGETTGRKRDRVGKPATLDVGFAAVERAERIRFREESGGPSRVRVRAGDESDRASSAVLLPAVPGSPALTRARPGHAEGHAVEGRPETVGATE